MYLNFSNFQGWTSAGGGDKPWSKNGDKCRMGGGLAKFLPDGETPSPPQEKTLPVYFSLSIKTENVMWSSFNSELFDGNIECDI